MSVKITKFSIGRAVEGSWTRLSLAAHVEAKTTNPAIGIIYVDGPSSSIKVKIGGSEHELPRDPNTVLAMIAEGVVDSCTDLDIGDASIRFPSTGMYKVRAVAGYVQGDTFFVTDSKDLTVSVGAGAVPKPPITATDIAVVAGSIGLGAAVGLATKRIGEGIAFGTAIAGGYLVYRAYRAIEEARK